MRARGCSKSSPASNADSEPDFGENGRLPFPIIGATILGLTCTLIEASAAYIAISYSEERYKGIYTCMSKFPDPFQHLPVQRERSILSQIPTPAAHLLCST